MTSVYSHITHEFPPIFRQDSKILILGSMPSVKSREQQFYYGHPQNRFWKMLAEVLSEEVPETIEEKKQLLYRHQIALWDVIASCDIIGSSDSSIKNVVPNDMDVILKQSKVEKILVNGTKAYELFKKYCRAEVPVIKLPSTSPANAKCRLVQLTEVWGAEIKPLNEKN